MQRASVCVEICILILLSFVFNNIKNSFAIVNIYTPPPTSYDPLKSTTLDDPLFFSRGENTYDQVSKVPRYTTNFFWKYTFIFFENPFLTYFFCFLYTTHFKSTTLYDPLENMKNKMSTTRFQKYLFTRPGSRKFGKN